MTVALLLALVTGLGIALKGNPGLQQRILGSALAEFPVIGDQIRQNVHSLNGNGVALLIGIGGALWGGMGVMKAMGSAMDELWEVPKRDRPGFVATLVRALLMLIVVGTGVGLTALLAGIGTGNTTLGSPLKAAALVAAAAVNVGVFLFAFRVLTGREVALRALVPGAVLAGIASFVLQSAGTYVVTHQLRGASQTYGTFAVVIGLLSWLYLQAQVTLLAAEINVVRHERLWPRALAGPPFTDADKRAYRKYAKTEERQPDEDVEVTFGPTSHEPDTRDAPR